MGHEQLKWLSGFLNLWNLVSVVIPLMSQRVCRSFVCELYPGRSLCDS